MLLTVILVRSHKLFRANDKMLSTITLQKKLSNWFTFCVIEIQQSSYDVSNEEVAADCDNLEISTATSHLYYGTIRIAQLTC